MWLQIRNRGSVPYRICLASIDPDYYPPLEAAYANHFKIGKRILEFGLLALLFVHLLILLPFKILGARSANRKMDAFFVEHGIGWGRILPGKELSGFVFTELDEGTKRITVRLMSVARTKEFAFAIPIPGLRIDRHSKSLGALENATDAIECDEAELRQRLSA